MTDRQIILSTLEHVSNMTDREFKGYHSFRSDDGSEYGSFEVFYYDSDPDPEYFTTKGWYWWSCFPGCLPDADPNGPFPDAEGAYLDALEGDASNHKSVDDYTDAGFPEEESLGLENPEGVVNPPVEGGKS